MDERMSALPVPGALGAAGFGAGMAKAKNHITHNQSKKRAQIASRNPNQRDKNVLKGWNPSSLMNMLFAKKYNKKGLKKMEANIAKAMSTSAKAIRPS